MLAIGRALMCRPRLLMLDEPSMGLSPLMMKQIMSTIRELRPRGSPSCWWSRTRPRRWGWPTTAYVLEVGKITLDGTGEQLLGDDRVKRAYLGED